MAQACGRLVAEYLGAPQLRERGDRLLYDHLYRLALYYFQLGDNERLTGIYHTAGSALNFLQEEELQVQWNMIQLMRMTMQRRFGAGVEQLIWAINLVESLGRECQLKSKAMDELLTSLNHRLLTKVCVQLQQAKLEDPGASPMDSPSPLIDLKQKLLKFFNCIPQSSPSSTFIQLLKESQDEGTPLPGKMVRFLRRDHIREAFLSLSDSREAASNTFEVLLHTDVPPLRPGKATESARGAARSSPAPERRWADSLGPDAPAAPSAAPAQVASPSPQRRPPTAKKCTRPDRSWTDAYVEEGPGREVTASHYWDMLPLTFSPPLLSDSEELVPMQLIRQGNNFGKQQSEAHAAGDAAEQMDTTDLIPSSCEAVPPTPPTGGVARSNPSSVINGRSRGSGCHGVAEERATQPTAQRKEVAGLHKSGACISDAVTSSSKTIKSAAPISAMDGRRRWSGTNRGSDRPRGAEERSALALVQDGEVAGPSNRASTSSAVVASSSKTIKSAAPISATDGRSRGSDRPRAVEERSALALVQDGEVAGPSSGASTSSAVASSSRTTKSAPPISTMDSRGNDSPRVVKEHAARLLVPDREVAQPRKRRAYTPVVVTSSSKTKSALPISAIGGSRGSASPRGAEDCPTPPNVQDGEVAGSGKSSSSTSAAVTSSAKTTPSTGDRGPTHVASDPAKRNGRFPGDGFTSSERQCAHRLPLRTADEAKEEWSDEEELFVPSNLAKPRWSSSGRKKMWTVVETQCLKEGVARFGVGNWSKIKQYYNLSRSNVQIKDRWRNICK